MIPQSTMIPSASTLIPTRASQLISTTISSAILSTSVTIGTSVTIDTTDDIQYYYSPIWIVAGVIGIVTIIVLLLSVIVIACSILVIKLRKKTIPNVSTEGRYVLDPFQSTAHDSMVFNDLYQNTHQYDRLIHSQSFNHIGSNHDNLSEPSHFIAHPLPDLLPPFRKVHVYEEPNKFHIPKPYEEPLK